MKRKSFSKKALNLLFFICIANFVPGQEDNCKVMMPSISGYYSGNCKEGLANGTGIAQGIDHYEGHFKKGLPHGQGTYTWINGSFYKGEWEKGLRNGIGKMVYRSSVGDSIVSGSWEKDVYKGKKVISSYRVITNQGVVRYVFRKISDNGDDLVIKLFLGSQLNKNIEGFSMAYDSGDEFEIGSSFGLQSIKYPLIVKIRYRTLNQFHTSRSDVLFEFELFEPGKWELSLTN